VCPRIRVLLLARNRLLREALGRILRKRSDIAVQAECEESSNVPALLKSDPIEVILTDPAPNSSVNFEWVSEICRSNPAVHMVMVGMEDEETVFLGAVQAGAAAYLLKDASAADVVAAIRAVARGEAVSPPRLSRALFRRFAESASPASEANAPGDFRLTRRQQQLVPMIARGLTNKEIASHLNLSEQTVKNHVHRMLQKCGAEDRLQAVEIAALKRPRGSISEA
jgi:DNA-binding NarL/FixJ family response regulator